MSSNAYIPSGGLLGKFRRLNARFRGREPMGLKKETIISITFDDFPMSARNVGAKALEKRGWRGTFYTATGFAGTRTHHGEMMTGADVTALAEAGHEIACHTLNHVDLCQSGPQTAAAQIDANRSALEELGHTTPLTNFAFPFGEASPPVKKTLAAQFKTLRGVQPGINRTGDDRLLLKAVGIDGGVVGLSKCHAWIKMAKTDPGWLILYAHDIQNDPTEWGCTPEQFEMVLETVEQSGAKVMTVDAAYNYLTS